MTFQNKYCAICNGEMEFTEWVWTALFHVARRDSCTLENINVTFLATLTDFHIANYLTSICKFSILPPENIKPRFCLKRWRENEGDCIQFKHQDNLRFLSFGGPFYKNFACCVLANDQRCLGQDALCAAINYELIRDSQLPQLNPTSILIVFRMGDTTTERGCLQVKLHLQNVKVLVLAPRNKSLTTLADKFRADLVYSNGMQLGLS